MSSETGGLFSPFRNSLNMRNQRENCGYHLFSEALQRSGPIAIGQVIFYPVVSLNNGGQKMCSIRGLPDRSSLRLCIAVT